MDTQITEENFYEILETISEKRYASLNETDALFAQMLASKDTNNLSEHVWNTIGLELYLLHRLEEAEKAYLIAAEIAELLEGEDRSILTVIYGDLSMVYEADKQYSKALEAMTKSYEVRKSIKGEGDLFTKLAAESVRRLKHLAEYKPNEELEKEFNNYMAEARDKANQ